MSFDTPPPLSENPARDDFHPLLLEVYERRLGSASAAQSFLRAPREFPEPTDLANLDAAVDRILVAVDRGERITIFGHDDPDGITSCAVLVQTLESLEADVDSYIPARDTEGHGLYPDLIRRFHQRGTSLLVTTDGCSANVAEVTLAGTLAMDVIVTDHHEIAEGRPGVAGLVNPKAEDPVSPLADLTGAGVAALVARAILRRRRPPRDAERFFCQLLDLVALGTIADWADVGHHNRNWVVYGLSSIARGDRPSLAIMRRALEIGPDGVFRVRKARQLAAAFACVPSVDGVSPGLNALLGRSSWAGDVDDLLRTFLRQRDEEQDAIAKADELSADILAGAPAVLMLEGIAPRWLGRVATKLSEQTHRPAVALFERGDQILGELRGPAGVHLVEVLGGLRDLFDSWGGHRTAAGFSGPIAKSAEIQASLRAAFEALPEIPKPSPTADVAIRRSDVDLAFSRSLRAAMPFGPGNPTPVFRVAGYRTGGTAQELDARESVGVRLFETGFPARKAVTSDPLVTFQPRGGGGLAANFVGWSEPDEKETS